MTDSTRTFLVGVLAIAACDGGGTKSTVDAADPGTLQGTWSVAMFDGMAGGGVWTFSAGHDLEILSGGSTYTGSYTTNDAVTPHEIEVAIPGATPNPNLAIYRFDSPTHLVIKLQDGAPARATTFDVEVMYDTLELDRPTR